MINTLKIYEELSQAMPPEAARNLASVLSSYYEELRQNLLKEKKEEFAELRAIVRDLAEAQKRTEGSKN